MKGKTKNVINSDIELTEDHESIGNAPKTFKSFIYSDTLKLTYKLFIILFIGIIYYIIGTINVWSFLITSVIVPLILILVNQFIYKSLFISNIPLFIYYKYVTFMTQNLTICICYIYGTDYIMSELMTWILRINLFECIIDILYIQPKTLGKPIKYMYIIPTIMLAIPLTSISLNKLFPVLKIKLDDNYLCVWTDRDIGFIIIYTAWIIGWFIERFEWITLSTHVFIPLLAPPRLWFSLRSHSGMFIIWFSIIKPFQPLIKTKYLTNQYEKSGFGEVYDSFFVFIFLACYIIPTFVQYEDLIPR